jgi:hypothetical protein
MFRFLDNLFRVGTEKNLNSFSLFSASTVTIRYIHKCCGSETIFPDPDPIFVRVLDRDAPDTVFAGYPAGRIFG